MTNTSGIHPTEFKVLIKPTEVRKQTPGGLHLPDDTIERDKYARTEGELIAVSPAAFTYADWPEGSRKPQPGDRVVFARYNHQEITGRDGAKYWLASDRSIEAVME